MSAKIILTVTNDLSYDQRMHRIAGALVQAGYEVELTGRRLPASQPLPKRIFKQTRIRCIFIRGPLFYAEYNLRLFVYLLRSKYDAIGTVDYDTLPAGAFAGWLRRKKRVFDAHEFFTEVPELANRPLVKGAWNFLGKFFLRFYQHAYTVGPALAERFTHEHRIPFEVVRNTPVRITHLPDQGQKQPIILYQGALNLGRGIETALDAMVHLPAPFEFWLAGEGDLSEALRHRAQRLNLGNRVRFLGWVAPEDLANLTRQAWLGLNLLENQGLSYYFSLANKFFDYVQNGIPSINMEFPEYISLNRQFEVAILLEKLDPKRLADEVLRLWETPDEYSRLQKNCLQAAHFWNWEADREVLLKVWRSVIPPDSIPD